MGTVFSFISYMLAIASIEYLYEHKIQHTANQLAKNIDHEKIELEGTQGAYRESGEST